MLEQICGYPHSEVILSAPDIALSKLGPSDDPEVYLVMFVQVTLCYSKGEDHVGHVSSHFYDWGSPDGLPRLT